MVNIESSTSDGRCSNVVVSITLITVLIPACPHWLNPQHRTAVTAVDDQVTSVITSNAQSSLAPSHHRGRISSRLAVEVRDAALSHLLILRSNRDHRCYTVPHHATSSVLCNVWSPSQQQLQPNNTTASYARQLLLRFLINCFSIILLLQYYTYTQANAALVRPSVCLSVCLSVCDDSQCETSPSSCNEQCHTAVDPQTKPTNLACESACTLLTSRPTSAINPTARTWSTYEQKSLVIVRIQLITRLKFL